MNINTKGIKNGIITIEGKPLRIDMTISELEDLFNSKIENREEYVGHYLSKSLIEDGEQVYPMAWFKGENIEILKLTFGEFQNEDDASKYLNNWLNERGITEWIGSDESHTYYKTEFGALIPSLVHNCYDSFTYAVDINLKYGQLPSRKFTQIKENKNNIVDIVVDDVQYRIQRIPHREASRLLPLINWLGDGPMSIDEMKDKHSKNDRKEIIYFNLSKIENGTETIIGIAEFTYLAVWDTYKNSELFSYLDALTEEWGIIAFAIDKYGCGMENKKGITPYILAFENIHDEIPHNKELDKFTDNENCMNGLLKSAMYLTSRYVIVPEADITLISVSQKRDNMFSYYKKCEDIFINYQRSVKNATVTRASGNASQNSLKYQLNIPSEWAKQIGLTKENKDVLMAFDGKTITITKNKKNSI